MEKKLGLCIFPTESIHQDTLLIKIRYTKQYGHTEWVTTVAHLDDGKVISGGMDSKVIQCLL